ncbi:MAG: hypothetical protein KDA76_00845 [Planctomycetaceae bacterium]|nr:hypothetical protein [Planctomycetaceae bacterium]
MFGQRFPGLLLCGLLCGSSLFVAGAPALVLAEDKPEEAKKITYDDHILPIFRQRCGSCHNANDQKGGLALDTYAALMQGGGSGDVVEAGDAGASYLYMVVTHDSEPYMPPNQPKMPDAELALIREWIELGALENKGSKAVKKKQSDLAKIEISTTRPADAPVLPQGVSLNPVITTSSPNSVTALAVSPWASLAAVSGQAQVLLFNTETGLLSGVLPFPEGIPQVLKFSRNGQLLLAGGGQGGASGKVVVWDIKTGARVAELGDEYDSVLAADISADHSLVVLSGPKRMVRVYSLQSGELLYELKKHTDWVLAAEFSPDGVLLATADRSYGMFLWEALTGNEYLSMKGHTGAITDISWRPDSNIVASSSEDGTIRLWELNNGNEVKRWNAHGGGVAAMDFTREMNLVSIGRDKTVKLWNGDGANLKTYGGLSDLGLEVAYDAELKRVLGGDWAGEVRVWDSESTNHLYSFLPNPPGLNEQLSATQLRQEQIQQELAAITGQINGLNQQIAGRKQAFETSQAKMTELEAGHKKTLEEQTAVGKQLADAKGAQGTHKSAWDQAQNLLNTTTATLQAIQKELSAKAAEKPQLEAAVTNGMKRVAELSAKLEELQKQGDEAKSELEKVTQEHQAAVKGLEEAKTRVAQLAEQVMAQTKMLEQTQALVSEQTKSRDQHKLAYEQQVASVQALEAKSKQVGDALKAQAGQIESQKKSVADLQKLVPATEDEQKKLAELAGNLKRVETIRDRLQAHLAELQRQISGSSQAAAN